MSIDNHKPHCAINRQCLVVHTLENPCKGYECNCREVNPISIHKKIEDILKSTVSKNPAILQDDKGNKVVLPDIEVIKQALTDTRNEALEEVEDLIAKELLTAHREGTPTSRLTSLVTAINKLKI